jgi:hypothetical protein
LLLLFFTRNTFTVKSRKPDPQSGLLWLPVFLVVAVGYGVAGFWLFDERHYT